MSKRIKRRGTFKSLVRPFPPAGRLNWKKKKLLTVLANRRQEERRLAELDPSTSLAYELTTESGAYLVLESSTSPDHSYIITE